MKQMSAKHTPAPWHLIRCNGRDDSAVATIEPAPPEMGRELNYWTVATCNGLRDEWAANARLISASPDLLAALQAVHDYIEDRVDVVDGSYGEQAPNWAMYAMDELGDLMKAALKKARG